MRRGEHLSSSGCPAFSTTMFSYVVLYLRSKSRIKSILKNFSRCTPSLRHQSYAVGLVMETADDGVQNEDNLRQKLIAFHPMVEGDVSSNILS